MSTLPTPPSVAAPIVRPPELPMPEIKALWQKLFGANTPTHNRQFLERRLAYKLQEVEFRRADLSSLERNTRCIASLLDAGQSKKRDRAYRPAAGTVLTREYQGIEYRVAATADGQYDFQGRLHPRLSMIAREITGTRWSCPLFFGLKAPAKPKGATAKRVRR